MLSSPFTYEKAKVIQALRFHFISRREIKIMIILINVFAITSAILFYVKKLIPLLFSEFSLVVFLNDYILVCTALYGVPPGTHI